MKNLITALDWEREKGCNVKTSQRIQKPRQGDQLIHWRYTKSSQQ